MSNIMAAIGIVQLERFPTFAKKRQCLAKLYDKKLKKFKKLRLVKRNYNNVVPHIYVIRINDLKDREKLRISLLDQGIEIKYPLLSKPFTQKI